MARVEEAWALESAKAKASSREARRSRREEKIAQSVHRERPVHYI